MRAGLKHVPLKRWIQLMIDGFETVDLAWVNQTAMIGYTWLFVYESTRRYVGRMNAGPDYDTHMNRHKYKYVLQKVFS